VTKSRTRLWANGGAYYELRNIDYNYYTWNSNSAADPSTGSLPVKDTYSFTKNIQILPAAGFRHPINGPGTLTEQGMSEKYYSSIPADYSNGYSFNFWQAASVPVHTIPYSSGLSIRCVRI
jgi:hypothetical protein